MANIKNFGLAGIGSDVQFGKGGGRLIYDSSSSFFKFTTDGSTLAQIRVATTPSDANDVASKSYVDGAVNGLDVKQSVRAATTAAGTLASDFENGDTIDGVTLATGDRILIKDQADGSENGVYTINASGAPTRATDFDADAEVTAGAFFFVEEGTTNADSGFVLTTNDDITVGSTALTFTQFSGTGQITAGDGLAKSGSILSVNVDDSTLEISADTLQIKSTYTGQTSITTLGTITTGTWNGSTIAIANGGTGATSAADARTNLGLAIGSDVQAYDAQLADIAGLTPTDGNIIVGDGSNFVAESGATARASLGLTIGTDVQAYDAQLADIAGLTPTDGNIIVGDGSNFVLESGATARTSLGLGTGDTPTFLGADMGSAAITNVADPSNAQDAATKAYVDTAVSTANELAELSDVNITSPADASLLLYDTGTSTWRDAAMSGDATITDTGVITLTDGASTRQNLGLEIGVDVQAYNAQLADIAGMTPTDGNIIVGDGTNFVLESGATARTSLGLGSIATQDANNVSISGGSISGVTTFSTGTLGSTATIDGDAQITGNLTVDGNLTVSGSSITLDVGTVTSEDKYMQVNSGATTQETGDAGGIEVKRSNVADTDQFAYISFDDSTDAWEFTTGSANQASTTNATMRFGTVTAGTWNGTVIGRAYGGFGTSISGHGNNSLVEADGGEITVGTAGQYLRSDGTNFAASNLAAADITGTVALANGGTGTDTSSFAASSLHTYNGSGGVTELAKGSNNTVLKVNGSGTLAYAQVDLTADVTGTLPVANGGTGLTAVGTVNKYLRSTGSVNQYDYVTALRDSSGNSIFEIDSANVADNTKIMVTNTSGEVTLQAIDPDDGTANIDLVLKGQGSGAVIINESSGGNSLIQADDTLDLTASGGVANGADAGDLVLKGGNGDGAYNSGDVLIKGGTGGAAEGKVKVLDSTNNEIAIFERTASAVNEVSITNAATGSGPSIAATGDDTNIDLVLSPKGTGVITVPSGYDANVSGDNDLVTKKWVEDNVVTSTDDLTIRTSVSSGSSSAVIGTMPNTAGITYYISKVTVYVSTGFSGGSVDHITIGDGSYTFVANADSDVTTAGTYVVDLPFSTATAGGSTLTLNFLDSGASAATPSGGAAVVTVEYKALS
jgi:hypothetical protein